MAKVICNIGNCKHRLRKPLRTYKRRDGKRCYGCELHAISVSLKFDPDLDVCIASCDDYSNGRNPGFSHTGKVDGLREIGKPGTV